MAKISEAVKGKNFSTWSSSSSSGGGFAGGGGRSLGLTPAVFIPIASESLFMESRSDEHPLAMLSNEWQEIALYSAS